MPDDSTRIAGTILKNDKNEYLLVQETRPDIYGKWGLPAGHVDDGETLQQAAVRETFEETGYQTEVSDNVPFYEAETSNGHSYIIFNASITGGELTVNTNEQLDVKWMDKDKINMLSTQQKLRDPLVIKIINKAESNANTRD